MTSQRYRHVLEPIDVGPLRLANRIFVPGHTTNYGHDHLPSLRHRDYHVARARGGVALIIFESIRVHRHSLGRPQAVAGYERASIEPFRVITDAVHAEGVPILGQVIHLGRQIPGEFERAVAWAPSPVRWAQTASVPHAMNRDDIAEVVEAHVVTARNVLAGGFDGFEVHLGHGHLLQQFLSPASNQRDDQYGGNEENRLRLPLEVLRAVRDAVGDDVCMGVRISGEEFIDEGLHLDEMCRQIERIADAVAIDFVNTSHSAYHGSYSLATQMADMAFEPETFQPIPDAIRKTLREAGRAIPVLAVCRYRTLAEAEAAIAAGRADMVGMARAHMADPELVNKSRAGREQDVRPCIGCNQGCAGNLQKDLALTCLVNPRMGLEGIWPEPGDAPAPEPKRVLVLGGGPAGAEAAWVAAARGHAVALWERADRLGGRLNYLREMPRRRVFAGLITHPARLGAHHGVAVTLGRDADASEVAGFAPDVVILATGSRAQALDLPRGGTALTLEDALGDVGQLGKSVAFYDTIGEWSTLGAIEHLADSGRAVTVFVPVPAFAWRTTIYSTYANARRLREKRVRIALMRRVLGHSGAGLLVEDVSTGEVETLAGFESLVAVQYNRARDDLYGPLRAAGLAVRVVGDALAPRTALEAVFEGHEAARSL